MLAIIALNVLLVLIFMIPAVQKRAADFALDKLKPKVKTEMSLKSIRIKLFNKVELGGLYVEDQQKDTLLSAEKISARINIMNLLDNHLSLESVHLEDFTAKISRDSTGAPFNFQFFIDAFASKDPKPKKENPNPMKISITGIEMKNGKLRYRVLSAPETRGIFNPGNIVVNNFNLKADLNSLDMANLDATVKELNLTEQSGIVIHRLIASARSKGTMITSDKLNLKINDSEINVSEAMYDLESKDFKIAAQSDGVQSADIARFAEQLKSLSGSLSFDINASGQLPAVNIEKLTANYGNNTHLSVRGFISDYSNYQDADLSINIDWIKTTADDIQTFAHIGRPDLELPEQVHALKDLDLRLNASGKLSHFSIDGNLKTTPGTITLKGTGRSNNDFSAFGIDANVESKNLHLGQIIGNEIGVDSLSFNMNAAFEQKTNDQLVASAKGVIESISYKGYKYKNMNVDVLYDGNSAGGKISLDNPLNKFDLDAKFGMGNDLNIELHGTIDNLFLQPFFTMENWQNPNLTARVNGEFKGENLDEIVGSLLVDSISLSDDNFRFNTDVIYLGASVDSVAKKKKLEIYTSFLEAELNGDYYLSTIGDEFLHALNPHLPSLFPMHEHQKEDVGKNKFDLKIDINNTEDLFYALGLSFYNAETATIKGTVDMTGDEKISLSGHFPRIKIGSNDIRETVINLNSDPAKGIDLKANTYFVQENGHINAKLTSSVLNDSLSNNLEFNVQNSIAHANGNVNISLGFLRDLHDKLVTNIQINKSRITLNSETITINPATIVQKTDSILINNFNITQYDKLLFGIDGVASKLPNDTIRAYFNNTEIGNFLAAFNVKNVEGTIKGDVIIHQALQNPIIHTNNFRLENIIAYNDTIGTLRMKADWETQNNGLDIDAHLTKNNFDYLSLAGYVPTGDTSPMDISIKLQDLPLAVVQPFAEQTFSQLSGTINSNLKITGKTSAPITEGWLGVDDGIMKVAMTNVTYRISDTIRISKDNVGLNNLIIRDNNNHTAKLNLTLSHVNFGEMAYRANIELNDFLLLNTNSATDDFMAYGTLKLSGNINVSGSSAGIYGDATLRNGSKSNVMIELPQTSTATEYDGIIYINTPQEKDSLSFLRNTNKASDTRSSTMPINFRARLNINPSLEAGVVINPSTGDKFNINGQGELTVNYDSRSIPSVRVYGEYVAEEGKFKYNFQRVKNIDFNVREGSKITMIGDPLNSQFDITAYHQVKASLSSLNSSFSEESATKIPVNAILKISGNLNSMSLIYDIETPELTTDTQQKVKSYVTTDEDKLKQFASLIMLGNFSSSTGGINFSSGNGGSMEATLASYALKGLDAILSSALNDNWSISTNIQSEDGTFTNARMGVDLSTRLLDDRLRLKTNLSYGDKNTLASEENFMGEFDMEYDLYSWLMLRIYNHANQRFYKRAATTQGVGLVVTKEGLTIKDLFRFRFGQRKEQEIPPPPGGGKP